MRLAATISGVTGITGITISEAHNSPSATAMVTCNSTTLDIGDRITINMGFVGNTADVFYGYIKGIEQTVPENTYILHAQDDMILATDYFIASSNPETPFTRQNISAEDLVQDIMALAQLTSYTADTSNFTFGITVPVEVNLVSCYDFSNMIADIIAYAIWADRSGTIHFEDRRPYVMAGDTPEGTISDSLGLILGNAHRRSDRDLRNKIVVYGGTGVYASAEEESEWLPSGFRKTVVVASPYIGTTALAQDAADYNLDKLNRLTEEISIEVLGDPSYEARTVWTVSESYTGISGNWYVYSCEHKWGQSGYTVSMELRK